MFCIVFVTHLRANVSIPNSNYVIENFIRVTGWRSRKVAGLMPDGFGEIFH